MTMPALPPSSRVSCGDGRRGHRPEQAHIGTGGDEARFERGLEHVAGDAGVLADQYCRGHAVAENAADRAAETQHEFRRDRMFARAAANAISAEILFSVIRCSCSRARIKIHHDESTRATKKKNLKPSSLSLLFSLR